MDPYLEAPDLWPLFQAAFVTCLRETLALAGPYQARVRERCYRDEPEQYVEIVRPSNEGLVTLVDVVSPSNKTTSAGREAYLSTRQQAKATGASLVEIDLVLQGQPTLEFSRDGLPPWDYAVTVVRVSSPERYEIYTATLQKRLPRFRLPLAAGDRDSVVDLQSVFARCYDQADFGDRINYRDAPAFLHDRVAIGAYYLWKREGCPHGRDKEHWSMALEQLRKPTEVR
jgi:hypothetical protein